MRGLLFMRATGEYGFTGIMLDAISSDCSRYLWYETICRVGEVNDYSERGKVALLWHGVSAAKI